MLSVKIIAEAGVNHNGCLETAKEMIELASESGADFVKFQTFNADDLVLKEAEKADYQKKITGSNESHYDMIKKLELSERDHLELINYSKICGIQFLSAPFDIQSVDLLNKLEIPIYKIPSGEITNLPYIQHIGSLGKPIILSTGMCNLKEIEDALNVLIESGANKDLITILHCNTEYPTPMRDVNLNAMLTIKNELGFKVGYSDHTLGIEVAIAAVSLGATIIEKHFTLDRSMDGPDHRASLEPDELKDMIKAIRNIELAMGDGVKRPSDSESKNIIIARKSIIVNKDIKKGDIFSIDNLTTKRPGYGISAARWNDYIGKISNKNYQKDDLIDE